jgi:hypothetical protein
LRGLLFNQHIFINFSIDLVIVIILNIFQFAKNLKTMKLKKIIFLSILGIVLVIIGFVGYSILTTRSHSPASKMEFTDGDFHLSIDYCRPYKKGRLIFGEKSEDALLPFGEYWRTGANEATEIEFNQEITINGNILPAGRYRFYTVPGQSEWTVAFNTELGKWGYAEPDYNLDIYQTEVPVNQISQSLEQFTITGEKSGENSMDIVLAWDQTQVKIPVNY